MAKITSYSASFISEYSLTRIISGAYNSGISYGLTYNGVTYPTVFDIEWSFQNTFYITMLGGDKITYSENAILGKIITGGIITGFLEFSGDGKKPLLDFAIEGISISATRLYDALRTPSQLDDREVFSEMLSGNDYFIGSDFADWVSGGYGNDTFSLGKGNDVVTDSVNGSGSIDTFVLSGKRSEYSLTVTAEYNPIKPLRVEILDKISDRDGADSVANVERIQFSDVKIAVDINGNAGEAYRLYTAAFARLPDDRGLSGWIKFRDDGGTLISMSQQFIDSQEFRIKYGQLDDRNFVNLLYLNVLGRNGEAAGVNGWVNGIANGMSRAQVLIGFSESGENQSNVYKFIKDGMVINEWWLT